MGAWIEIENSWVGIVKSAVAPHMGAWIEIVHEGEVITNFCRTPHGCVD